MKRAIKRLLVLTFIFIFMIFLFSSFVSANIFSDFFGKITGKVVNTSNTSLDSGWLNFNTVGGACISDNGNCADTACHIQGGYCGCSASGYGLDWIQLYPSGGCINNNGYRFLCQGQQCLAVRGTGMGKYVKLPASGNYYVSIYASWDAETSENLYVGVNDFGNDANRRLVKDFSSTTKCVFKKPFSISKGFFNNAGKVWVETSSNSNAIFVKQFKVSSSIPSDVEVYCEDGSSVSTLPSGHVKILPPEKGIYLGAYDWKENGINPGVKVFEDAIGKKVAIVGGGGGCLTPEYEKFKINVSCLNELYSKGYVTEIDLTPRDAERTFTVQEIIEGKADYIIEEVARDILLFNKPIFIGTGREPTGQFGWGFDGGGYGPNGTKTFAQVTNNGTNLAAAKNQYGDPNKWDGPERYVQMNKHMHDVVERITPNQVTWVSYLESKTGNSLFNSPKWMVGIHTAPMNISDYYTGDNYSDWVAYDIYPMMICKMDNCSNVSNAIILPFDQETISWLFYELEAAVIKKPLIVLEFGVHKNVYTGRGEPGCPWKDVPSQDKYKIDRTGWFNDFFTKVKLDKYKQFKAFVYWQMGEDAYDCSDDRIDSSDPAAKTWRIELINNSNFWVSDVVTAK